MKIHHATKEYTRMGWDGMADPICEMDIPRVPKKPNHLGGQGEEGKRMEELDDQVEGNLAMDRYAPIRYLLVS